MTKTQVTITQGIKPLFGTHDENISFLESALGVTTHLLEDSLEIEGAPEQVRCTEHLLSDYESLLREGYRFNNGGVKDFLRVVTKDSTVRLRNLVRSSCKRNFGTKTLVPRSINQMRYFDARECCDVVFGIWPAPIPTLPCSPSDQ